MIAIEDFTNKDFKSSKTLENILNRAKVFEQNYLDKVRDIIDNVIKYKDEALYRYALEFDNIDLRQDGIEIPKAALKEAYDTIDDKTREAIEIAYERVYKFHENQKEKSFIVEEEGIILGQRVLPVESAGLYVPGGKAAYPSSVIMNAVPAKVAGVPHIYMVCPKPTKEVLAAAYICGIDRVFRIGGAQSIAALAYGTETVPPVEKIVGPGNIYVATAKRLVYGIVGIDMIAGPSEVLIIADASADPTFVAMDMLSQAEHDELASAVLVTNCEDLAYSVAKEIENFLTHLERKDIASKSIENYGAIFIVKNLEKACELANVIAPEHLEINTENPFELLGFIKNAGAIFLGEYTVEALGDYCLGPNHTLPTGRSARFSSALGVYDFVKRSSILFVSKKGFDKVKHHAYNLAKSEGLHAHASSIELRGL
ncbi:histidinol dehydrogenase [Hydrogenobaculum acidophilum]